jgi:hypothetical protein
MSKWDIQVNGVVKVLKDTAADAKGFETQATKIGSAMQSAGPNTSSGLVGSALQGFAEKLTTQINSVSGLTGSAIDGCGKAVVAYQKGDLEMAARAQSNASSVHEPDMPRGHGGPR